MSKILNICIGHKPFPAQYRHYFDYMLSPFPISEGSQFVVVYDKLFGENGASLSEYAQLFWLLQNLDRFIHDETHIRVFQYRKFVSDGQTGLGEACSLRWARAIREAQLGAFHHDFARCGSGEMVNTPYRFPNGILGQYGTAHPLEDFMDFAKFLLQKHILNTVELSNFLRGEVLIPAGSIGVLTIENFKLIYSVLLKASAFMSDPSFPARTGYQRRNMGFLLERLNSYLLLKGISEGTIARKTGIHMIISDDFRIKNTDDLLEAN
jgi:hypothetical protein